MATFSDYRRIADELNAHWEDQGGTAFRVALESLREIVDDGHVKGAEFLAEILALPGPHRDPAAAYKWYFIALSQQGYTVEFQDENGVPPVLLVPGGRFPKRINGQLAGDRAWLRARAGYRCGSHGVAATPRDALTHPPRHRTLAVTNAGDFGSGGLAGARSPH